MLDDGFSVMIILAGIILIYRLFRPKHKKHIIAHITVIKPPNGNDNIPPFSEGYQMLYESLLRHAEEEASKLQ